MNKEDENKEVEELEEFYSIAGQDTKFNWIAELILNTFKETKLSDDDFCYLIEDLIRVHFGLNVKLEIHHTVDNGMYNIDIEVKMADE